MLLVCNRVRIKYCESKQHSHFSEKKALWLIMTYPKQISSFNYEMLKKTPSCCPALQEERFPSRVKFQMEDEDIMPTMESNVILNWLDPLCRGKLVNHVFRVFFKELQSESLTDLCQTISDNLDNLLLEANQ